MAKEIKFERLDDGSWDMIKDDPEDPEFEIVLRLDERDGYAQIEKMKEKGWKTREEPGFFGFILYKEPFKFPKEWAKLENANKAERATPPPEKRPHTRQPGEVAFRFRPDGVWEEIVDDPENPELEMVKILDRDKVFNKIENMKRHKWKVYHDVDLGFTGCVLYKER